MNQRDRIAQLAKTDFEAAERLVDSIDHVRERIQALGWLIRYAPAGEVPRMIADVNQSAGTSSDFYGDVMALAWPLRALHETNHPKRIPPLRDVATSLAASVSPASSRAHAIFVLANALIPAGVPVVEPVLSVLMSIRNDSHWRVVRAFVYVSLLINAHDQQRAAKLASAIPINSKRTATLERIHNGDQLEPRVFFW